MAYDTYLFIEIIESIKGVTFIREEENNGAKARFYEGLSGKLVIVECSDEDMDDDHCKGCLAQLGLEYLIPSIFPSPANRQKQEMLHSSEVTKLPPSVDPTVN